MANDDDKLNDPDMPDNMEDIQPYRDIVVKNFAKLNVKAARFCNDEGLLDNGGQFHSYAAMLLSRYIVSLRALRFKGSKTPQNIPLIQILKRMNSIILTMLISDTRKVHKFDSVIVLTTIFVIAQKIELDKDLSIKRHFIPMIQRFYEKFFKISHGEKYILRAIIDAEFEILIATDFKIAQFLYEEASPEFSLLSPISAATSATASPSPYTTEPPTPKETPPLQPPKLISPKLKAKSHVEKGHSPKDSPAKHPALKHSPKHHTPRYHSLKSPAVHPSPKHGGIPKHGATPKISTPKSGTPNIDKPRKRSD